MSEKEVFERKVEKRGERTNEEMGYDGDGLGRAEIVEEAEVGVRTGAKASVCCEEVGEKNVIVVTDGTPS